MSDYDKDKKIHELEATIDSQHLMLEQYAKFCILSKADREEYSKSIISVLKICSDMLSVALDENTPSKYKDVMIEDCQQSLQKLSDSIGKALPSKGESEKK